MRRCCGREVRGEVLAILTPEQQAEAAKIQAERDARMKQFRTKADQRGFRQGPTSRAPSVTSQSRSRISSDSAGSDSVT